MILCEASPLPAHTAGLVLPGYQGRESPGALEALEASYLSTLKGLRVWCGCDPKSSCVSFKPKLIAARFRAGLRLRELFQHEQFHDSGITAVLHAALEQVCT